MRAIIATLIFLVAGCQLGTPDLKDAVFLSQDNIYPLSDVASSNLNTQFVHQVTYQSYDNQQFSYLVQLDINSDENHLALVATSLLGVPLISFEMNGKQVVNVKRTSPKLPEAKRLIADLQFMFWPLQQLNQENNVNAVETCKAQCVREIYVNDGLVTRVTYGKERYASDIKFENLVHQYQMTIKNL